MARARAAERVPEELRSEQQKPAPVAPGPRHPLVLDLDGTLLVSDLLVECILAFLKHHPLQAWRLVYWALQGRAVLKERLAERTQIAVELLPAHAAVVAYAEAAHAEGREVYLATASDRKLAEAVSKRYPFIREVLASGGRVNLKGRHKAAALKARFPDGFVYAGDSRADVPVWRQAAGSIFVGPEGWLRRKVGAISEIEAIAHAARPTIKVWARALRLHQWAKNAVLFAPLVLSGRTHEIGAWVACGVGFVAMGLIASSTYLINDLTDLEDDRRHWTKRNRPLASGALSLVRAMIAAPLMLTAGLCLAFLAGGAASLGVAAIYCALTLAYSLKLKRIPLFDALVLASLFTLRLLFGAALAQTPASSWLLVFCMTLFVSLALAKRAVEFGRAAASGSAISAGRGYRAEDAPLVAALGGATGVAAVLVMILYVIEDAFPQGRYLTPQLLWGAPVLLSMWLGRVWLLCARGELDDDPVAFAVKDRTSLVLGGLMAFCFLAAAMRIPWL